MQLTLNVSTHFLYISIATVIDQVFFFTKGIQVIVDLINKKLHCSFSFNKSQINEKMQNFESNF